MAFFRIASRLDRYALSLAIGLGLVSLGTLPVGAQSAAEPDLHSHAPLPNPTAPGDGFLHFPGFPPIPIRPQERGYNGFGSPAGTYGQSQGRPPHHMAEPAPPPKPLTPEEKAAAVRKALAPRPPLAETRKRTLDELFAKLASARDADEAKGIAGLVTNVLVRSDSDTANLLMQRVGVAMQAQDYRLALKLLDSLATLQPDWADVWARRAQLLYLKGDLDGAMSDAGHALKLEPRHFGTLEVMALVLQQTGFDKRALEVYRRLETIYPHQSTVEKSIEKLQLEVEGQGI